MTSSATHSGRRGWSGAYRPITTLVRAVFLLALLISPTLAQNNVGIGTTTPDPSALLDLTASDKGLLVPRVSDGQMLAVLTPATGLLVFNTTENEFYYFDGTQWVPFLAAPAWSLTGNAATTVANFLGTTDANPLAIRTDNTERMIVTSTGSVGIGTSTPLTKLDLGDGNLSLTNTTNTAGEIRWYEPSGSGTNYTAFKADPMTADVIYTWPTSAPAAGQTLTAGATPTQLQWSTVAGGAIDDTLWFVGAGTSSLVGRGNNNSAAGAYGIAAGYSNQANGNYSVSIGGQGNVASGLNATVSGGYINQSSGNYATIAGGQNNVASSVNAFVGGGNVNQATAQYTVIAGGQSNVAAGNYSGILSGASNNTSSAASWSSIAGGQTNAVRAQWSAVLGGQTNQIDGNYSTILGGQNNSANGIYGVISGLNNSLSTTSQHSMVFGANASVNQPTSVIFHHAGAVSALYGQTRVGIRTVSPTEALDVAGNVKFSNALMPNNLPGTSGQLLVSQGANTAPIWSNGSGLFWSLTGNAGTSPSTNFLGTTDNIDLVFRTNNIERVRLDAAGFLGVGTSAPTAKITLNNGNLFITNTDSAGRVRFFEPSASGTNYTDFRARTQAANISYVLPDTAGRANDVLTNDGNGNLYWTNNILTGSFYLGSTTTTTFTADVNDFTLDANYTLHRISAANSQVDVSGFAGGVDGRVVILVNVGSPTMTLLFESGFSQATNRIIGSGGNFSMQENQAVSMVYDGVSQRWRIYAAYP